MTISEPSRKIPVIDEVDVCVVGGSCTGVFAAVRAAQMGMRTAIIEKQNAFGGAAASGLVHIWHSLWDTEMQKQIISGLTEEMIERLKKRDSVIINEASPSNAYRLNTEELKIELDNLISENKIIPHLHSMYCGVIYDENNINAVVIESKSGRGAIKARFFIDATGDGDVCRGAGVPSYTHKNIQPPTMCAKIQGCDCDSLPELIAKHGHEFGLTDGWGWRDTIPGGSSIRMHAETRVFNVNCADANDLTFSEMEGRQQLRKIMDLIRKYSPQENKPLLVALPSYIGIRETYHIRSKHQITNEDLLYGKRYEDAVANGSYRVDIHHSEDNGITFKYLDGTSEIISAAGIPAVFGRWREKTDENPTFYQVPYRALIPGSPIGNLLYAGRMIDSGIEAFSALRVMVNTNQMGEAAGVAAALAVSGEIPSHAVSAIMLREKLHNLGAMII